MSVQIGSLFAGYGGLEMGIQAVLGGRVAWHSEIDRAASRVLARHWPGVPNLGDITAIDWATVPRVDVLAGGFPCQDVSTAGRQAGLRPGTRSGLWSHFAYAIDRLRPALVVAENVRGMLSAGAHCDVEPCPWCVGDGEGEPALRALGAVLGDLADLRYDAAWHGLRASDVGAPHGRFRVFVVAWPAAQDSDGSARPERRVAASGQAASGGARADVGGRGGAPTADADGSGWQGVDGSSGQGSTERGIAGWRCETAAHATGYGWHEGRPESARVKRGPDAPERRASPPADADGNALRQQPVAIPGGHRPAVTEFAGAEAAPDPDRDGLERIGRLDALGCDPDGCGGPDIAWGGYEPAVRRWEHLTGRRAPNPTEPGRTGPRLSPRFVEWMMGLPEGHVTATPGLSSSDMLRCLGNGVVPQQSAEALQVLLPHAIRAAACRVCAAVPGQPCRLVGIGARLHRPHRERLLTAIFGGRP